MATLECVDYVKTAMGVYNPPYGKPCTCACACISLFTCCLSFDEMESTSYSNITIKFKNSIVMKSNSK